MFGFGKARHEATMVGEAAARMAIAPFWDKLAQAFDTRIWSDPFVLGIITGSIYAQIMPSTGRKLSEADRKFALLGALRNLGASQPATELAVRLHEAQEPEYMRGHDVGITTFVIMSGALKEEAHWAPEIILAKEAVPTVRRMIESMNIGQPIDPNRELALAFVLLQGQAHQEAHYR